MNNKIVFDYLDRVNKLIMKSGITLPKKSKIDIYHHMGIDKLNEVGATFLNIVNRDYCKSLVVMTTGQKYPNHYHRIKTESFFVLYGELVVKREEEILRLFPGDVIHIERGQEHSFWTDSGVVFEEISTKYFQNDSVYIDNDISNTTYDVRRTTLKEYSLMEVINVTESKTL